ncbi:Trk family potassium uptake protein [bacterium]|nr:Trk family potassium uptake protein [bacterium]
MLIKVFTRTRKFSRVLRGVRLNTAQIVALSFIVTIFIGMILLTFPTATTDGHGANLIDALFTSTSATCVTGLIVQDTPRYFSQFGQWVILVLIQLGGLGIMTYSAFVALLLKKLSLGQRKMVQEMFEEEQNVYSMIFYIVKMTFFVELAGMILLFIRWNFMYKDPMRTLYFSLFHSVSAFCNAGFSLHSNSLENFTGDLWVNGIIMLLIIIGGLGFIVIYETSGQWKKHKLRLSTHSLIVIFTSAFLIVLGFLVIFFFEFDGSLVQYPLPTRFLAALFQSVTTRTAGFNTVPIGPLSRVSLTFMILLMFIGASPGSTGGGIKTTTFAVLLLSVYSILRSRDRVEVFHRTLVPANILKALTVLVFALVLVVIIFGLLLATEDIPYLPLLFETVSAFGTVGLSTGITASLSSTGKLLIVILMFAGRIGPLTLGLALAREMKKRKVGYPDARVMIG